MIAGPRCPACRSFDTETLYIVHEPIDPLKLIDAGEDFLRSETLLVNECLGCGHSWKSGAPADIIYTDPYAHFAATGEEV